MTALRMSMEITGITEQIKKLEAMDHTATEHLYAGMKQIVAIADKKVAADLSAIAQVNLSSMMAGIGGGMIALAPANPALPGKMIQHDTYVRGSYDVVGVVKSKSRRYMKMAQEGRTGGKFPPQSRMRKWVTTVMGITAKRDLQAVAGELGHAIARGGVRGAPTLEKSLEALRATIASIMKVHTDKLAEEMAVKGGPNGS